MKASLFLSITFLFIFSNASRPQDVTNKDSLRAVEQLNEYKREVNEGKDFEVLAALYSADTASAKKGGDLGEIKISKLDKKLKNSLEKLKAGKMSEVSCDANGCYLYQVINRKGDMVHLRVIYLKK